MCRHLILGCFNQFQVSKLYPLYKRDDESVEHFLLRCGDSQSVLVLNEFSTATIHPTTQQYQLHQATLAIPLTGGGKLNLKKKTSSVSH